LVYLPPSNPARASMSLHNLLGARCYLVKLSSNSPLVSWSVHGRVLLRPISWLADSLNFVGFQVDAASPPTFQSFFAGSPAHAGQPIYRLNNGIWQRVLSPGNTRMSRGEAFWVKCSGPSSYSGPLLVSIEQSTGLDYGSALVQQPVRIRNTTATNRTITI